MTDETVRSADGTTIAFERTGSGPAVVLVEAAGHHRGFSSFDGLAPLLADRATTVRYDRRGRGASGDTPPYDIGREVDDLAALVAVTGPATTLCGFSSGALLALHAAADGVPVAGVVAIEPPLRADDTTATSDFTRRLRELVGAGRDEEAVEHFHAEIGVPPDVLAGVRGTPAWNAMVAAAPTLAYDAALGDASPPAFLAAVTVPTLVLGSAGSDDDLADMAATVAAALPRGDHRTLPGGWHGPDDAALAAAVVDAVTRPTADGSA